MNHLKAISIKLIYIALIILSLFGIFSQATLTNLILLSILTTIISYFIGDVLVYPRIGNVFTTIFDFGFSFLIMFTIGGVLFGGAAPLVWTSLAGAFFIMCIEPLFHAYMTERVFQTAEEAPTKNAYQRKITQLHPQYLTEFAEEKEAEQALNNHDKNKRE